MAQQIIAPSNGATSLAAPLVLDHYALVDYVYQGSNAVAVLEAAARLEVGDPQSMAAVHGLKTLASVALERASKCLALEEEHGSVDMREKALEEASALYEQAIAVCGNYNDDSVDDPLLYAATSLMALAKANIDASLLALLNSEAKQ